MEKDVGTASQGGTIKIVGKIPTMKLFMEGIQKAINISPYVVEGLAHHINLGQNFLRENQADMIFRPSGTVLKLGSDTTKLVTKAATLTRATVDTRISPTIEEWRKNGGNPGGQHDLLDLRTNAVQSSPARDKKGPILWSETKRNCYSKKAVYIPSQTAVWVETRIGQQDQPLKTAIFAAMPVMDNKMLNKNEIHVHPGIYAEQSGHKILVTNVGQKGVKIPEGCKLGYVYEAIQECIPEINALEQKHNSELTESELNEWRAYIAEGLKLDQNELLKDHPEKREAIIQIFVDNKEAIARHDHDYGMTSLVQFNIELKPDAEPSVAKLRPLNPFQEKDLQRQLNEWLEGGIIEEAMSPWAAALVPCKKKNSDKLRWALDFRSLNSQTVSDNYPLPNIENNLHKLSGSQVYTTVDAIGAFHNILIDPQSRDLTAFITPFGQYRFTRVAFGLKCAPAAYSRLIQKVLSRLPAGFALAYIDDVIIHSTNLDDHIDHLRQVVEVHATSGIKINLAKCAVAQKQVEYLGHLVSKDGIAMIPSYVEKVLSWPIPTTGKELRSFLGFTSYYRSFIKEYAHLTHEMNKLKNDKTVPLAWPDEVKDKFEKLKACFSNAPVRGFPEYQSENKFILDCDWSATNMAAVLSQVQQGREVFLGCAARKCSKSEKSYPAHKGELAALVLGCKKFEHILRAKPFLVRTDSNCVKNLMTMKECRGIYARMQCFLSGFDYEIEHRAGKKHTNADALSRRSGMSEEEDQLFDHSDGMDDIADIYHVQDEALQAVTVEQLQQHSKADPVINKIMESVKHDSKPDREARKGLSREGMTYVNLFECLKVENDILYFISPSLNGQDGVKRTCMPSALWGKAFDSSHALPTAGHFGVNATYNKLKQWSYWPNQFAYVQARVLNCVPCIAKMSTFKQGQHQLHREQLSYFGQRLYVDCVGPLTATQHCGQLVQHYVSMVDGFSRWAVTEPVVTTSTECIAKAIIDRFVLVHGCPETVHSDRGSGFTAKLFQEIMKQLGITHTVTPPYTPSGNRAERFHGTVGRLIRADRRGEAKEWPRKLAIATFAYNTTMCRATGMSPFEAVFGHKALLPVDFLFPMTRRRQLSTSNTIDDLKKKYQEVYQKVCKNEQSYVALSTPSYQARKPISIQEGDIVYYFLGRTKRGLSKKLQSRWTGPFKVTKKISESLFTIFPVGTWANPAKEIATVVNRLKKVDPDLLYSEKNATKRHQINLPAIVDEWCDLGEVIQYSDDIEDDTVVEQPSVSPAVYFRPTPREERPESTVRITDESSAEQSEPQVVAGDARPPPEPGEGQEGGLGGGVDDPPRDPIKAELDPIPVHTSTDESTEVRDELELENSDPPETVSEGQLTEGPTSSAYSFRPRQIGLNYSTRRTYVRRDTLPRYQSRGRGRKS